MADITEIKTKDGPELLALKPPVQRAAYSDRTAWQMAILAELAYIKFEEGQSLDYVGLARQLIETTSIEDIASRLKEVRESFATPPKDGEDRLRTVLEAAGFELVGRPFFNMTLDWFKNTEGYVAKYTGGPKPFAVLAIRGTTSPQDWINNAKVDMDELKDGRKVHSGFKAAFFDAEPQMRTLLKDVEGLPLFITGHSLGGAVAVMATWYFDRDDLAACYTFGAPRVGNHAFNDGFHTPIYRVVNAFDPVPLVPPSGHLVSVLKFIVRTIGKVILEGPLAWFEAWLKKNQGYRHAGDLRHMTAGKMDADGRYPTVKFYTHFGVLDRINRLWQLVTTGQLKRLDKYHDMSIYRRKLRARARKRAPK